MSHAHTTDADRYNADTTRLLSRETSEDVIRRVQRMVGHRNMNVSVQSWWDGERRWARNRVRLACDRRDVRVVLKLFRDSMIVTTVTNQLDDLSLQGMIDGGTRSLELLNVRDRDDMQLIPPLFSDPNAKIWSNTTYDASAMDRGALAQALSEQAESHQLMSAGYLEFRGGTSAVLNPRSAMPDTVQYLRYTQAQCSMTVRHPKGTGSGWAGLSGHDWGSIDGPGLAQRALEKCLASLNPVAIEPGRYTVILEPQAACDLIEPLMTPLNYREAAESGRGPFAMGFDPSIGMSRSKLGLKVIDERITIEHDPEDPFLGIVTLTPGLRPIKWIENGVLTALSYGRERYSLSKLNENVAFEPRDSFRMSGGMTTREEMITSTNRGLIVTRFSGLMVLDRESLLYTGLTRDGLWLVEKGKITKAVRNLRFTESPLFVLNQIEQLGTPVPVFRPNKDPYNPRGLRPAVVPSLKARDFSFTSTVDAI